MSLPYHITQRIYACQCCSRQPTLPGPSQRATPLSLTPNVFALSCSEANARLAVSSPADCYTESNPTMDAMSQMMSGMGGRVRTRQCGEQMTRATYHPPRVFDSKSAFGSRSSHRSLPYEGVHDCPDPEELDRKPPSIYLPGCSFSAGFAYRGEENSACRVRNAIFPSDSKPSRSGVVACSIFVAGCSRGPAMPRWSIPARWFTSRRLRCSRCSSTVRILAAQHTAGLRSSSSANPCPLRRRTSGFPIPSAPRAPRPMPSSCEALPPPPRPHNGL